MIILDQIPQELEHKALNLQGMLPFYRKDHAASSDRPPWVPLQLQTMEWSARTGSIWGLLFARWLGYRRGHGVRIWKDIKLWTYAACCIQKQIHDHLLDTSHEPRLPHGQPMNYYYSRRNYCRLPCGVPYTMYHDVVIFRLVGFQLPRICFGKHPTGRAGRLVGPELINLAPICQSSDKMPCSVPGIGVCNGLPGHHGLCLA